MADESSDDELSPYVLKDLKGLDPTTSQAKGTGCFGSVYQVTVDEFPCVAKCLHDILTGYGRYDSVSPEDIRRRFREECVLLCKLRHPNIVQFIGVHYGSSQDDLILVIEALYMDLKKCLNKHSTIPIYIKLSILLDVSYGLLYLHSQNPPIIHRDLTATNVLVTRDMKAKISGLGVSKILNLHPESELTQTVRPGTRDVMPPEALVQEPHYDTKLDVFSFGCLALHTVNREFPEVFEVNVFRKGEMYIARRRQAIIKMGENHCLHHLVHRCLLDDPERRPDMAEISRELSEMVSEQPSTQYNDVLYMFEEIDKLNEEIDDLKTKQAAQLETIKEVDDRRVSAVNMKEKYLEESQEREKMVKSLEADQVYYRGAMTVAIHKSESLENVLQDLEDDAIHKQGFLKKRKGKALNRWKKRLFVLDSGVLAYYKTEKPVEEIPLSEVEKVQITHETTIFPHTFEIHTREQTFHLAASSEDEMLSWITVLQTRMHPTTPPSPGSTHSAPELSRSSDTCLDMRQQYQQRQVEREKLAPGLVDCNREYSKPPTPLPQVTREMNEPQPPPAVETKDRASLMATGIYMQPPPPAHLQDNLPLVAPAQYLPPPPQAKRGRTSTGIPQDNPPLMAPVQASDQVLQRPALPPIQETQSQ